MNIELEPVERECPYLGAACFPSCPGWIAKVDDCLFNVCLTQVKENFTAAAKFLDERLGLEPGVGYQTLAGLRATLTEGDAKAAVGLIMAGVAKKVTSLPPSDLKDTITDFLGGITFDLSDVLEDEDEEI